MTLSVALSSLASMAYLGLFIWAVWRRVLWQPRASVVPHVCLLLAAALSSAWCMGVALLEWQPLWLIDTSLAWLDGLHSAAWIALLLVLLGVDGRSRWPQFAWAIAALTVLAVLGTVSAGAGMWSRRGQVDVQALSGLVMALCGLVLVEQLYRNAANDRRWNAKPLCLGLIVMFGFDLYQFAEGMLLRQRDMQAAQLRPIVAALGVPLLVIGLGRGAALLASMQMSRSLVFHSATLLLSGLYLLLVAGLGYWVRFTGGQWGATLQLLLLVGALVLLAVFLLSGAVRAKLRVWVSKTFFRYRYDYREEWLRFTAALASRDASVSLGESVVRALAALVESPAGGLWQRRGDDPVLVQTAHWNFDRAALSVEMSGCVEDSAQRGWVVDLNDWRQAKDQAGPPPPDWLLQEDSAWLMIPLLVADGLHGVVVLCQPRAEIALNWEVRDLLKTASSQAAGTLAMLEASEQLLEARKFEAFNRMSAFVVHDLKNIVTQLSLMMKNAERHGDNPEFRRDMNDTVNHALEKMRQLMLQLREGNRPTGVSSGVSLQAIARRLQASVEQRGRELQLSLQADVQTRGVEERVERVIGHAVQNALDASSDETPVRLTLDVLASYARVRVTDQGVGMSSEFVRERLFKPFQTTKKQGMGIGAFESLQYVRELGGKMEVQSEPDRGTCITFLLPLFHSTTVA